MDKNILELKIKEGKSERQIACDLKCTRKKIYYWLRKHGLRTLYPIYRFGECKNGGCICGETDVPKYYKSKSNI